MLYTLLRPLVKTGLRFFYKKLYLSDMHRMSNDRAVILATNHPSAFLEPSILACYLSRPMYFLVRGNFFNHPFYRMLLLDLNMLPIYRRRDGNFKDLKRNFSLLDQMYQMLDQNKVLMILAEGNMKQERRLRPLQKGTARLAFGAHKEYGKSDIQIVPVGVNFDYADQYRQVGMLQFGEPMELEDYLEAYAEHPNKAIRKFTNDLRKRLEPNIVIVEDPEDDELAEQIFTLHRNDHPRPVWPIIETTDAPFKAEKQLANCINSLEASAKNQLRTSTDAYQKLLDSHRLNDVGVARPELASSMQTLGIIIGFLPSLIGYVLNLPPYLLAEAIIKNFVKKLEFIGPIRMAIMTFGSFFYYLFGAIILGVQFGWLAILGILAVLALGYFSILYREFYRDWRSAFRFRALARKVQRQLGAKRQEILRFIREEC